MNDILINAFMIVGIWFAFQPNSIFYQVTWLLIDCLRYKIEQGNTSSWDQFKFSILSTFLKPLILCIPCMASIWGGLYYFFIVQESFQFGIVHILSVSGVCLMLQEMIYGFRNSGV